MKVTRRALLRSSSLAAAAALLDSSTGALASLAPVEHQPNLKFPTEPRDRLAVASWPFRAEIDSDSNVYRDKLKPGMDLIDFVPKIRERFKVPGFEPLSTHFSSSDARYLHTFREAIEKAGLHIVNIPVDNTNSFYDADAAARRKAVAHAKQWVDIAALVGSPSIRTSIVDAKNAKPNVELTAQALRAIVEYGASKNIIINLENDDLTSEDAFFVIKVIEKVNHPYLRALPDFCNSMMSGNASFNYQAVTAMFQHAYNICHVKDSEVDDDGKVVRISLKMTFNILKNNNFHGYCSMEWEGAGDPYIGTDRLIAGSLENL